VLKKANPHKIDNLQ